MPFNHRTKEQTPEPASPAEFNLAEALAAVDFAVNKLALPLVGLRQHIEVYASLRGRDAEVAKLEERRAEATRATGEAERQKAALDEEIAVRTQGIAGLTGQASRLSRDLEEGAKALGDLREQIREATARRDTMLSRLASVAKE